MADDTLATWAALKAEIEDLRALLAAQPDAAWERPTRLPGWSVLILVAHLARGIGRIAAYAATPLAEPAIHDRVSYWRCDAAALSADVDARAREAAQGQTPATLLDALDAALRDDAAVLDRLPADTVIPSVFGPITLGETLGTRLVEACVHGLDLRAALHAPPRPTPAALAGTVAILDALLGGPRPLDLQDDVAFVEAAAGRRTHPDPRLPLIG